MESDILGTSHNKTAQISNIHVYVYVYIAFPGDASTQYTHTRTHTLKALERLHHGSETPKDGSHHMHNTAAVSSNIIIIIIPMIPIHVHADQYMYMYMICSCICTYTRISTLYNDMMTYGSIQYHVQRSVAN